MVDEIFDRQYQAGRNQLHAAIGHAFSRLVHAAHQAFEVLVAIEYAAPWAGADRRSRCN